MSYTAEQLKSIRDLIAKRERSFDNYSPVQQKVNPSMTGRYQFNWKLFGDSIKKVTGVKSRDEFLSNKTAQDTFADYHIEHNLYPEATKRYDKLKKIHPNVSFEDALTIGHHQGFGNMDKGIARGNVLDFKDGSNVTTAKYLGLDQPNSTTPLITMPESTQASVTERPIWSVGNTVSNREYKTLSALTSSPATSMKGKPIDVGIKDMQMKTEQTLASREAKRTNRSKNIQLLSKGLGELTPYASNLYNMTMKPAKVPQPIMDSPVNLSRVNMNADRNMVESGIRSADLYAEQNLDPQAGYQAKAFNNAQRFTQMSTVNQTERNQNVAIGNQQAVLNNSITAKNNEKVYNTRLLNAERENTIKSMQSANIADMGNKAIQRQNLTDQYELENRRLGVLEATDYFGTYKAILDAQKKANANSDRKYGGKLYNSGRMVKLFK